MSYGGKKYNVWIAYSDLFTNLSTFLFISAVGVFAAMGSGLIAPSDGESATCSGAEVANGYLEEKGSLLRRLEPRAGTRALRQDCVDYYRISDFRFHSSLSQFKNDAGRSPSLEDVRWRVCLPIWLTLADQRFVSAKGQITFVGIGVAGSEPAYPTKCGGQYRDDLWIEGFPRRRRTLETIRECQIVGSGAYPVCRDVLACLKSKANDRDGWCRSVIAAERRGRRSDELCQKGPAELQAKALYDICEGVPLDRKFPTQRFETPNMVKGASRVDELREQWPNVSFDGATRDGTQASAAARIPPEFEAMRAGSVLLKVEHDP